MATIGIKIVISIVLAVMTFLVLGISSVNFFGKTNIDICKHDFLEELKSIESRACPLTGDYPESETVTLDLGRCVNEMYVESNRKYIKFTDKEERKDDTTACEGIEYVGFDRGVIDRKKSKLYIVTISLGKISLSGVQQTTTTTTKPSTTTSTTTSTTIPSGGIKLKWPTIPACLTSPYESTHRAIDISVISGTPVYAGLDGEVVEAQYKTISGNYIKLKHIGEGGQELYTLYNHLKCNGFKVKVGDTVTKGQYIADSGGDDTCKGEATGPHLHFEFRIGTTNVDPCSYFEDYTCASC